MVGSVGSTSSGNFNWQTIGNVGTYSANAVKSFLAANKGISSSAALSGFNNSFLGTINNTVANNATFTKQNVSNLSSLKSASSALSSAARSLGVGTLASSDKDVVEAKASYYSKADFSFDVSVSNIATAQKSTSAGLKSADTSAFGVGQQSFSINTEKGSYNIGFSVSETDTNNATLNKIASAVNSSNAGITAKVETKDGESFLSFTSVETGEKSAFTITPDGGSDAASRLNMEVTEEGTDANYKVNGKEYTSSTNTVSIPDGRGATMTLKGAGSAELTREVDASKVVAAAENFAAAYNKTVEHLMSGKADGNGVERALSLVADNKMTAMSMSNYGGYASSRLSSMGISIDDEGMMQIDSEKLTAAVQQNPNTVKNALSGYGSVSEMTRSNADAALRIPAATYTNFSNMQVQNSLIDMMLPSSGFLFDFSL